MIGLPNFSLLWSPSGMEKNIAVMVLEFFLTYLAMSSPESQLDVLVNLKQKATLNPTSTIIESQLSMSLMCTLEHLLQKINVQTKLLKSSMKHPG